MRFKTLIIRTLLVLWFLFMGGALVALFANSMLNFVTASSIEGSSCCYELAYSYTFPVTVTNLETKLLTLGVTFSGIQYDLSGGWRYEELQNARRLRWTFNEGQEIPGGEQPLFNFCLANWNANTTIELEVIWRVGQAVAQRDTLRLECSACWSPVNGNAECQADSSYLYRFDFQNRSDFPADFLLVQEPIGQDYIATDTIWLSTRLFPRETTSDLVLTFDNQIYGSSNACFAISPRYLNTAGVAIACCSSNYCISLPECDFCCNTPYEDFAADVFAGFSYFSDCENNELVIFPNQSSPCDVATYSVAEVLEATVSGPDTLFVAGLTPNEAYYVCMTLSRQNTSGDYCYLEAGLSWCDTIFYCLIDAVTEEKDLILNVYPNPAGNTFTVSSTMPGNLFLQIHGIGGTLLREVNLEPQAQLAVDVQNWPSGNYLLLFFNSQRALIERRRIIIRH